MLNNDDDNGDDDEDGEETRLMASLWPAITKPNVWRMAHVRSK